MTIIFSNAGDEDCQILRRLWNGIDNVHVVEVTRDAVRQMGPARVAEQVDAAIAAEPDFLLFCGHGTPGGLVSPTFNGYLFSRRNMGLVRASKVLCIWCYAEMFCRFNRFGCLTSSMYISNSEEAAANGFYGVPQPYINETNALTFDEMNGYIRAGVPLAEWPERLMATLDCDNRIDSFNRGGMRFIPSSRI